MQTIEYKTGVKVNEVMDVLYPDVIKLQFKRAQKLRNELWDKTKANPNAAPEDRRRLNAVEKSLLWLEKKLKELDGETIDMKGQTC